MMSIFSSISWADFLIVAITLLLLFNIAVVVYYQAFYKGDKPNNPIDNNKFATSESSDTIEEEDEEEDDNNMMFVSYDDEEETDIQPSNEPAIVQSDVVNDDVQVDSNTTEEPKEEEKIEVEIDEETDNEFSDVSQDLFFTDGEVVSEELADDIDEAFAMLGFSNQEDEGEGAEVYPSDDDLMEASVRSFNIQSSDLDDEDNLFLQIKEQLSNIQEKENEEALKQNSSSGGVDENFFGSSPDM